MEGGPVRIVYASNYPWSGLRRRAQHLALALARAPETARVLYVNPREEALRFRGRPRRTAGAETPAAGPAVVTPLRWVPFSGRVGALARWNAAAEIRRIERAAGGPFVLLANAVGGHMEEIVAGLAARRPFLFDWTDDFTRFEAYRRDPGALRRLEDRIARYLRLARGVIAVNARLAAAARAAGADPVVVPNGADLEGMARALEPLPVPAALADLGDRPVLGYAGVFTALRIDADLLAGALDRLDGWTLAVLGDRDESLAARFRGRKDVRFLPPVPAEELPAWYRRFTVCAIPHLDNEHTRGNDPLKLYEALAAGRPVVTTPVAGVEPFRETVEIAADPEGFARAAERARAGDGPEAARARRAAVRPCSWTIRAEKVLERVLPLAVEE